MSQSEVKEIIRQLKEKEISIFDIPKEYENNIQIVNFERKAGLRISGKRGFDIIKNSFFVEEALPYITTNGTEQQKYIVSSFNNFDSYFDFLDGAIYDNTCYTFLPDRITISRNVDR